MLTSDQFSWNTETRVLSAYSSDVLGALRFGGANLPTILKVRSPYTGVIVDFYREPVLDVWDRGHEDIVAYVWISRGETKPIRLHLINS